MDSARAEGAEFVILVGHLGENGITERWSAGSLIGHIRGVDACIDGHSHETTLSMIVRMQTGRMLSLPRQALSWQILER